MEMSAYESMRDSQDAHWWFVGRRNLVRSLIDRLVKLPRNADVLEAGCGFGGNLRLLEGYGKLHAFEYNDKARAYAAERTSGPVMRGALPHRIGFGDKTFDLIALLDVLEHIDDDLASLIALRDRLTSSGSLVITVPAVPALWSRHDVMHHHKRRYSKSQLEDVLTKAGLVLRGIGYFNSLLFPLAMTQRLVSKLGNFDVDANASPPRPLNKLFGAIFSLEARLLGWLKFPIGLSLYAVVQKGSPQG